MTAFQVKVTVQALHPGFVATDMTQGRPGDKITPVHSAERVVAQMDRATFQHTGKFIHVINGDELPW